VENSARSSVWRRFYVSTIASVAIILSVCSTWVLRAQQTSGPQQTPVQQAPPTSQQTPQASQDEIPQTTGKVSVETNVVTLYATVRDKHGKVVPTLNKEDFTLNEDGRAQTISYFVRESDLPLTLGLLVDTSGSMTKELDNERDASFTFLDHMMRQDKDHAFVIHFDREVELLQDVTASKPKLQAALKLLGPSQSDSSDNQSHGQGSGSRGGGTHLYDAIYLAAHDLMMKQKGRKAIFVMTDGEDRGSKETLEEAIEAAQRADTAVYSLYFAGEQQSNGFSPGYGHRGGMGHGGGGWPGGGGGYPGGGQRYPQEQRVDGKKVMTKISTETGGRIFEVSKKLPIDQAYAEAEEELRNQYSLAYTPNPPDTDAGYHRIQLTVNQKDDSAQARDGYYSGYH
jgi:VWFA-related protein